MYIGLSSREYPLSHVFNLQETREKVLRRVLNLIDGVLGLEEGYLWKLHKDSDGNTGHDVCCFTVSK